MHPEVASKLPQIEALCRQYSVKRLDLFGSAACDDFDPARSDVDFLVQFLPIERKGFDDVYFELHAELERLFNRSIDLVETEAISNRYFRKSIEETKVPIYAAA
jgi:predicted nucleotidyltransferase